MPLHIIRQDITKMQCDAIVNTTNAEMIAYSGVDLAIHKAAGARLDAECKKKAPLELGFAKITGGYELGCKYVIHTRGPIWDGGDKGERAILKSCYIESLKLARKHRCKSVAFPLISSGSYGYPKDRVLTYAAEVITEFLSECEMTVYLCVFDRTSYEFSKALYSDIQSYIDNRYAQSLERTAPVFRARAKMNSTPVCDDAELDMRRMCEHAPAPQAKSVPVSRKDDIDNYLKGMNDGFRSALFSFIDEKGISDVECYKRANIDKKVFSKIKCNKNYKPSKQTAVAFAIALELTLEQTKQLLEAGGLALSHSNKFDMIIEYFILKGNYNIIEINEALFEFDQNLLGSF